jgi:hypothetical protein
MGVIINKGPSLELSWKPVPMRWAGETEVMLILLVDLPHEIDWEIVIIA